MQGAISLFMPHQAKVFSPFKNVFFIENRESWNDWDHNSFTYGDVQVNSKMQINVLKTWFKVCV